MNAKQIEVCNYFKSLHTNELVLYHLQGQYLILGDDIKFAQKLVPTIQIVDEGVAIIPDDIQLVSALSDGQAEVKIIQYRNDDGKLDLPDINRIIEEKEADY